MAYNLLPWDREQGYLMPPSLREWLGEGQLAWFVIDAVGQMDVGEFYAAYRNDGGGAAAYDPAMMVGVLLYAYCQGMRSSCTCVLMLTKTPRLCYPSGSLSLEDTEWLIFYGLLKLYSPLPVGQALLFLFGQVTGG